MCVSLPINALCCASVLPSTYDYVHRACDTTAASGIAPARPKMLSIVLVIIFMAMSGSSARSLTHKRSRGQELVLALGDRS